MDDIERVGFAVYKASTDLFENDPRGAFQVSQSALRKRDLFVRSELKGRILPKMQCKFICGNERSTK